MNVHLDTLEYANALEKAGMARPHAEAVAKLQARVVTDLIQHELVTKDHLTRELALTKTELRGEIRKSSYDLRQEFRSDFDNIRLELRSLKYGAMISAFAVSCVVVLLRVIG